LLGFALAFCAGDDERCEAPSSCQVIK
jgi:hypothetical protein